MLIEDIRVDRSSDANELSAALDGFRLWYQIPAWLETRTTANPFVAAAFFPSMLTGDALRVPNEYEVSPRLQEGLPRLQEIFHTWNNELRRFNLICRSSSAEILNSGVATFFSGGVDGLYTLLSHHEELTHLVYINGFDFRMPNEAFEANVARLQRIASEFGKTLVATHTNFFDFNEFHRLRRPLSHGSCLASVALALGFRKCYIPASYTYNELHPWGTHPLLDHHWSTEATTIIHDGANADRIEKTERIAHSGVVLNNLVVCWDLPDRNCGECGKCMRTMIALRLLGFDSDAFPNTLTYQKVARLTPKSSADQNFFLADQALARRKGDTAMEKALDKGVRPHLFRLVIKEIDRRFFKSKALRAYRLIQQRRHGVHAPVTNLRGKR